MNKKFISVLMLAAMLFYSNCCLAQQDKSDQISRKYGFSLIEEQEIGFQSAIALVKKYGIYKDPAINKYVYDIGQSIIAKESKRPDIKYRFIILDTDEVNAFAAPGGFVFITVGTLKMLDNEAELAGVLSHEITHIEEGHGLAAISSDKSIMQTINMTKEQVDMGEGYSQKLMYILDKEISQTKDKVEHPKTPDFVNFSDINQPAKIEGGKIR